MKPNKTSKNQKKLHLAGIALIAVFFSAITTSAQAQSAIPDTINLNAQENYAEIKDLPKDKKAVNNFSHKKHAEEYVKGNSEFAAQPFTDEFTCVACHAGATTKEEITNSVPHERLLAALNSKGGPAKLKNYFHGICLDCHKEMKKAQKITGPTKCNDCHSRK